MGYSANITRAVRGVFRMHPSAGRLMVACTVAAGLSLLGYAPHLQTTNTVSSLVQTDSEGANQSLYAMIFSAQDKGNFAAADALISRLSDDRLMGYVLAQRYSSSRYEASKQELTEWLTHYADHPQLAEMLALAKSVGVSAETLNQVPEPEDKLAGVGYGEQLGRSEMPDGWYHGLQLWRVQDYSAAAASFHAIAANENLSDWHRAAGAYWEYRAQAKLDDMAAANQALAQAASYRETFYGILSMAQRGEKLTVAATLPPVPVALWNDAAIGRAQWLVALDRDTEAEAELRQRYATLNGADRAALVTVAAKLDLPNLQLRLAHSTNLTEDESLAARYPIPEPMLDAQHAVDPALLLAVAMHESGFRETVKSGGGALGMMQMLPSTAKRVAQVSGDVTLASVDSEGDATLSIHDRLNDMAMSTRLGASYFTMLRREPVVGSNMIRLLAAYNAGPGTVKTWQKTAKNMDDPLLYLESIPYPETHNYVVQVMAGVWMYQVLLNEQPNGLHALAHGAWPMLQTMKPAA